MRRLAESFNVMLRALATSRDQQKRLVTDASHELRTPLTSVRTIIELLAKAKSIDEKDKELIIRDLKTEINELSLLVDEIVNLATSTGFKSENFMGQPFSEEKVFSSKGNIVLYSPISFIIAETPEFALLITNLLFSIALNLA